MGWISVGALLAAISYILYRHLPNPETSPSLPTPSDSKSDSPPASPDKLQPNNENPATPPPEKIQRVSPQNTPKALESNPPPPILAVPTLNLEEAIETPPVASRPAEQSMNGSTPQVASTSTSRNESTRDSKPGVLTSQSTSSLSPSSTAPKPSSLMPPPPPPISRLQPNPQPNRASPGGGLAPPRVSSSPRTPLSSAASARLAPSSSTGLSTSTLAPTPQIPLSLKKSSASKRVILEPGYSPLDWAALAGNPKSQLRGVGLPPGLLRVTPSMLKTQNGRKGRDAWTSYQGKVFNISPYLPYHPGGKGELLRGAGKDSGKLFQEIHPWVNWDGILGECMVGILVSENDVQAENALDAMD
ncbi:hypothetical protein N7478_009475 [Penicillium angulare]|uniref:uncharacterized protein n=1 Tax=Penicillium angulare TaxID=116970 RepID=UPI0025407B38|nr:uncharacterized protein N7478_009475 [Penicillium angulare]KAJ5266667.1 hypothetical protein N7478_009475 [Penicillium angulare]